MRDWKEWLKAALVRALKTFAQTMVASISVGAAIDEIDWMRVLSVSGVAAILSILTSMAGLPEVPAAKEERWDDDKHVPPDGNGYLE